MRPRSAACDALVQPGGPLFGRLELRTPLEPDELGERTVCWSLALQREVLLRSLVVTTTATVREQLAALRGLEHPKIVPMLEWGEHRGQAWIVSERFRGSRVADTLLADGATLALDEFVPITAQVLMAVGHAHERGIAVGPITARNVSIGDIAGRSLAIRLVDFGHARLLPRLSGRPPISASAHDEPAADVFEVGLLMHELLYGIGDASARRDDLPPALIALLDDMLNGDARTRPANGNAVVERLIDAVPKALFKLPSTRAPGRSDESTAFGRLPPRRPSTVDTIPASPPPEPARSTADTGGMTYVPASIEPAPRRRWIAAAVVGTIAIGLALAIAFLPDREEVGDPATVTATLAPAAMAAEPPAVVAAPPAAPTAKERIPAPIPRIDAPIEAPVVIPTEAEPSPPAARRHRGRDARKGPPSPVTAAASPTPTGATAPPAVKPPKSTALLVDGAEAKPRSSELLGVDTP